MLVIVLSVGIAQAQGTTCPALVEEALARVEEVCGNPGRNEACYGHNSLEADVRPGTTFETVGDIASLADIRRLTLREMDEDESIWGISLIAMQANLPDTVPGQNVTFLLFGDVEVEDVTDDTDDYSAPMQAFYFATGVDDASCAEAPDSGVLIQTPEGSGEVVFQANGVDITLGSTVYMQAEPGGELIVNIIEGFATLSTADGIMAAPAGTQVSIPLDEDGVAADAPGLPRAYDLDDLRALPLTLLEREIEIAEPVLTPADTGVTATPVPDDDPGTTTEPEPESTIIATVTPTTEPLTSDGELVVSASGGGPLGGCSISGDREYGFNVVNESSRTIQMFWIDYDCNQVGYRTVEPGGSYIQRTFVTHPWIVIDVDSGEVIFGPWGGSGGFTLTVTDD